VRDDVNNLQADDDETLLESSHREWIEEREEQWQRRDEEAVERFLAAKFNQKD
jgi:hypothetical protein